MKQRLLTISIIICFLSFNSFAYDIKVENEDGVTIYYNYVNGGNELEVTRNIWASKYTGTVRIPQSVTIRNEKKNVTSIDEFAFCDCSGLSLVEIPNGVTAIGNYAFYGCSSLSSVNIPNSVTCIGDNVFWGCKGLTSLVIPDNVETIGNGALYECGGLTSITVGNSVKKIGESAFYGCNSLTSVSIGNSVRSIESGAFRGCTALKSVTIGNSVRYIGLFAFSGCINLSSITFGNKVSYIGDRAFESCTRLKTIEIPNSVTRIGSYAFAYCTGLTSIIMHNSISIIENYAFRGCTGLTSITIPSSVKYLGGSAFYSCSGLKDITIPSNVTYIGTNPFEGTAWYDNLPNGMIYKDNVCLGFKGNEPKGDITIEEGTRLIAGHAFNGCNLTSVSLPGSVISIGDFAFYGCSKLETIDIPNSVKSIGENAFCFCTNLGSFTIPESVSSIGIGAFKGTKWFNKLADGIIYKDNVVLGYIGSSPHGELNIAEGTRIIAESAFDRCESLTSVKLPSSVEHIGNEAFTRCKTLSSVNFGNSLKSIGYEAFYDCVQLKSITLPASLKSVDYRSFANCTGLEEVYSMNQHPNAFDYSAFMIDPGYGSYSTAKLYVPVGSKEEYLATEGWNHFSNILFDGEVIIAVHNYTREYGEENPIFEYEICDGKIESGNPLLTCSANKTSPVGTYDIVVERGSLTNDIITSVSGTLTITKAPLIISAGNYLKKEGEDNPDFNPIYTGFKNNETKNNLIQQPVINCSASSESPVGIYTVSVSDAEEQNYDISYKNGIISIKDIKDCSINGHDYVDLDLPSGKVWATMNYGASSEEESGSYIKWSSRSNVKNTWGEEWSVPNQSDIKELINYCDFSWVVVGDSVYGFKVTGKNGKSIFLPAAGYYISDTYQLANQRVCYWSDTKADTDFAIALDGSDNNISSTRSYNYLYISLPIRPVANKMKYRLTYIVDGELYKESNIEKGTVITPEPAPTREGHTFSGWSNLPSTMPAQDITVTGFFTVNKYKLVYMVDSVLYKEIEIGYGAAIPTEQYPNKEGYTFSGWSEIPKTMPASDLTVTGAFVINKYKLIYMVDNKEYKSYEIDYNSSITPEADPTKEGYIFSGWSWIPSTMPAEDVIVTGTFTANKYKLTYKIDGIDYKITEIEYGSTITPEPAPTKEGYTFSGWSWIPSKMPAEDVTITGTFTINKYKLTYLIDDEVYKTFEVEYSTTIIPEAAPQKDGYDFSGWDNVPETMPAHDVTINASFTVGITDVLISSGEVKVFDTKGNQIGKLQKGINILIFKNGERKKVVIK